MEPLPRFFPLDRAIAFSDGIFAVVITILVLGIEVPSTDGLSGAASVLRRERLLHQLLVYVVSFGLVGMYWSQHSFLFGSLKRMDRGLVVLNLVFLLPVTLLPFVTQLMGANHKDWRTVLVFAVTNLCAVLMFERLWKQVAARPEIHKDAETAMVARRIRRGARIFGLILISSVLLSLFDVRAGILLVLVMPVAYFFNLIRDPLGTPVDPSHEAD
ncbi:MAG TPA: TMEM175 family protein [Polyangiales bacterium]|nr:TMEM175 family protein [Polyangiales bacterium]